MKRLITAICSCLLLAACGGMHVRPPGDYVLAGEPAPSSNLVRVAFDQLGDVYPRDASSIPWPQRAPGVNSHFALSDILEHGDHGRRLYGPEQRREAEDAVVAALNSKLAAGDTLLVLVHGFNEDFESAQRLYSGSRNLLGSEKPAVILEVYWDGLRTRNPEIMTEQTRLTFWPDALLSSNYAGQRGLRPILNRLSKPVDLRFLVHSRGTAVALSAVADPVYERNFGNDPENRVRPLDNPNIRSIKIAAFAPAVGSGHVGQAIYDKWGNHPVDLAFTVNPWDLALSKLFVFHDTFWGDTSLGTSEHFVRARMEEHFARLRLIPVRFPNKIGHALDKYVEGDPDAATCIIRFAGLTSSECPSSVEIIHLRDGQ
ncbi:hypothetical protein [Cupriavidus necator]